MAISDPFTENRVEFMKVSDAATAVDKLHRKKARSKDLQTSSEAMVDTMRVRSTKELSIFKDQSGCTTWNHRAALFKATGRIEEHQLIDIIEAPVCFLPSMHALDFSTLPYVSWQRPLLEQCSREGREVVDKGGDAARKALPGFNN